MQRITLLDKNSRTISRRCGIFGGQSRPDYNYNVNKVQHAALLNSTSTKRIQIHKERKKKVRVFDLMNGNDYR